MSKRQTTKSLNKTLNKQGSAMIQTTIGDLICAIADAAREVTVDEAELQQLTEQTLADMLRRACA
jgi:hypothetical protein